MQNGISLLSPRNLTITLRRLPSMLHSIIRLIATGYSKVSRGLRFPLEIPGLCTRKVSSEDSIWGQCGTRYVTHARRQSNDKVFRYLKRVIVTPAVYLLLAPLNRSLKYRHWADVTFHTHPSGLAKCYVFVKQSVPPSHCALQTHPYGYKCRDLLYRR